MNEHRPLNTSYSPTRKLVHWVVLFLCIAQVLTGWAIASSHLGHVGLIESPWSKIVHRSHAIVGATVAFLVAFGIVLRLMQGHVPSASLMSRRWVRYAFTSMHVLICCVLLALSVTGFIAMYLSITAAPVHNPLVYLGAALIGLHAAAALWHQFVVRDGIITRMLPRPNSKAR